MLLWHALANSPAIVLADEPTANLDKATGMQIIELLRELNESEGVTIITATHDHKMLSISDRIAWVRDGQIERYQNRDEIEIEARLLHMIIQIKMRILQAHRNMGRKVIVTQRAGGCHIAVLVPGIQEISLDVAPELKGGAHAVLLGQALGDNYKQAKECQ